MIKKAQKDKAPSLKSFLIILTFISIITTSVGFYYIQDILRQKAIEASKHVTILDDNTQQSNQNINTSTSEKINNFFFNSDNYLDTSKDILTKYANDSGIQIESIQETNGNEDGSMFAANGTNSNKFINVTIKNPVKITELVKFLKLSETNLPKMQANGISFGVNSLQKDKIDINPITYEVYLK